MSFNFFFISSSIFLLVEIRSANIPAIINKIEIVINSAPKNNLGIKPKDLSSNHANIHCISNISPKIKKGEANIKKKLKGSKSHNQGTQLDTRNWAEQNVRHRHLTRARWRWRQEA